jgi:hypothetical protein
VSKRPIRKINAAGLGAPTVTRGAGAGPPVVHQAVGAGEPTVSGR